MSVTYHSRSLLSYLYRYTEPKLKCSRCQSVWYWCEGCQKGDLKAHSPSPANTLSDVCNRFIRHTCQHQRLSWEHVFYLLLEKSVKQLTLYYSMTSMCNALCTCIYLSSMYLSSICYLSMHVSIYPLDNLSRCLHLAFCTMTCYLPSNDSPCDRSIPTSFHLLV